MPFADILRDIGGGILDLVFPPLCVVCREPAERHLCDACIAAMPRITAPICSRCGRPTGSGAGRNDLCGVCRQAAPAFDACRAYGQYAGKLGDAVRAVKYHGKTAAVPALAELMAQVLCDDPLLRQGVVLVPVPLHPRRRRQRGFNQAELLARTVARQTGREVHSLLLAKVKNTRPQVGLSAPERRANLRDAFQVRPGSLPAGPLVLVDDVITTGATFGECARALRDAGARQVFALALAHD